MLSWTSPNPSKREGKRPGKEFDESEKLSDKSDKSFCGLGKSSHRPGKESHESEKFP